LILVLGVVFVFHPLILSSALAEELWGVTRPHSLSFCQAE
jgi:hypothetical protein